MTPSPRTANSYLEFLRQKLTLHVTPLLIVALSILLPQMASAGAWTLEKGRVWSKITYLSLSTTEHYNAAGEAGAFPGRYNSRQVFLDLFYGVNDRVDVGLQLPFINREFVDLTNENHMNFFGGDDNGGESGVGDLRGFAKINLVQQPFVGTLKLGLKAPIGSFRDVPPEAVSASDGQWDFDVVAQVGRSFWPVPLYANVDLGYRFRQENSDTAYDEPDGEFIYNAETGLNPMDKILVALKLEGIISGGIISGEYPKRDGRRITYLVPTLLVNLQPNLSLEAAARMSISGRADQFYKGSPPPPPYTYFAGPTWTVGISYSGDLFASSMQ